MLDNRLAEFAEQLTRHRRATTLISVFVVLPTMGAGYGLLANLAALLISQVPAPINHIVLAGLVALLIAFGEFLGTRYRDTSGDAANRGLTRVFGIPWIPGQERRLRPGAFEPWRTSLVAALIVMTGVNGQPAALGWGFIPDNPWIIALIVGAAAVTVKNLSTNQVWSDLLRRGPIPT